MVLDVPKNVIRHIDKELFNFVWKKRIHHLKKSILCNPIAEGGVGMIDFETSNTILKVKWIKNYILNQNSIWYHIPNLVLNKLGVLTFF